jgi:two-component system, OmpR family, response regulator RegX3
VRVLVVEDDPRISVPLAEGLIREGYDVHVAATAAEALTVDGSDLVLLDLGLPDRDGRVVCRELRARSDVPIIVVSARDEEIDRVLLLELGADDYVVKPFGFRELVARMRAVSRRTAGAATPSETIAVGALRIDRRSHTVDYDGRAVNLTPKEYDLLVYLAADAGAVKTRAELMHDVWDENWWGSTKTLDVHVASLRKKLDPTLIETVRAVGYRLATPSGPHP